MRVSALFFAVMLCVSTALPAQEVKDVVPTRLLPGNTATTKLGGQLGERFDACVKVRVMKEDVDALVAPFNDKTETRRWQSEFWGKWMLGAVLSYRNNHDSELLKKIEHAVDGLLKSQSPDGYIGNYAPEARLKQWDVWGRKYSMLGLLSYYDLTGDKKVLDAVKRLADYTLTELGPGKTDIVKTGNYYGMASSSILEPMVFLYKRTGEQKYFDFAKYIVAQWETDAGPKLISKADVPVAERFPHPVQVQKKGWFSPENGQKAYEMMSCYEGLLELYRLTGEKAYLDAVEKTVGNIIEQEINIAGSGSAFECWYHGCDCQTLPTYHTMETCVTMTWMKLCQTLLGVTGNPMYADQIELSAYNALLASMKADASQIAKYSPLEGKRTPGEEQCGMKINCCNANGPRAFALLPQVAVMPLEKKDGLTINLYMPFETEQKLASGKKVKLRMETNYPADGAVKLEILETDADKPFEIFFRIPEWSKIDSWTVQEGTVLSFSKGNPPPGEYVPITIQADVKKGTSVTLNLDVQGRVLRRNNCFALMKGPVVLARDSRFNDGFVDETARPAEKDGFIELTPVTEKPADVWLAFTAPLVLGTDLEGEAKNPKPIKFCDFGSAGNTWEDSVRYRVWIPETLNVMKTLYKPY